MSGTSEKKDFNGGDAVAFTLPRELEMKAVPFPPLETPVIDAYFSLPKGNLRLLMLRRIPVLPWFPKEDFDLLNLTNSAPIPPLLILFDKLFCECVLQSNIASDLIQQRN